MELNLAPQKLCKAAIVGAAVGTVVVAPGTVISVILSLPFIATGAVFGAVGGVAYTVFSDVVESEVDFNYIRIMLYFRPGPSN